MMRVKNRTLVLHKHSTVETTATALNQCKDVGHSKYDYEIEVTVSPKLDSDDFIIDHTMIHLAVVDVVKNKMGSCERLCLTIEEEVIRMLERHGCEVKKIIFSIKPVDSNAWIRLEGEYEPEEISCDFTDEDYYDWINSRR